MCIAAGCTAFLTKPIKQAVLLRAIKDCTFTEPQKASEAPTNASNAILIRVNPNYANRIPAYLLRCKENVATMLEALDQNDFKPILFLGHQLRGSGGMFGFQQITDIGQALEEAAEHADPVSSR